MFNESKLKNKADAVVLRHKELASELLSNFKNEGDQELVYHSEQLDKLYDQYKSGLLTWEELERKRNKVIAHFDMKSELRKSKLDSDLAELTEKSHAELDEVTGKQLRAITIRGVVFMLLMVILMLVSFLL